MKLTIHFLVVVIPVHLTSSISIYTTHHKIRDFMKKAFQKLKRFFPASTFLEAQHELSGSRSAAHLSIPVLNDP